MLYLTIPLELAILNYMVWREVKNMAHKEIVQTDVLVAIDEVSKKRTYETAECEIEGFVDVGDVMTFTTAQMKRYNQGLTLEAQRKLRPAYLEEMGIVPAKATSTRVRTKGKAIDISME